MFYYFLYPLREVFFGFNVFKYITFRAAGSSVTAFLLSALLGRMVIDKLRALKVGESVRKGKDYASLHEHHKHKEGTPTMGGVLILGALCSAVLLWADLSNRYIWIALLATLWLGGLGFIDDYIKLRGKKEDPGHDRGNEIDRAIDPRPRYRADPLYRSVNRRPFGYSLC
jgi:UDP-N-acetylmuramyl pentapeptide phosphotransferase/UDP-N-acetylglucosamine-1-phosphate transferase